MIEKETYDKPSPPAPDAVAVTAKAEIPLVFLQNDIPNNKVNQQNEKSIQLDKNNVETKIKSNSGTVGTISPLNIVLGVSTTGIKATDQIKFNDKESEDDEISPLIDARFSIDDDDIETSDKIKSKQKSSDGHDKNIPSRISGMNDIPIKSQTKLNTKSIEDTNQRTGKALQPPSKTVLSSKKAINEFIGTVLYRFNYTAGYHGHNEEGDSLGNKLGGYFIVGRDNIKRGVIYVANENGFIPMVKYEKVSSAEAPHEDTEKNAGLKGYEFEWFHKGKSKIDDSSIKHSDR